MGIIRLRLLPCLIVLLIPSVNLAVIAGFQQQSKGSAHQGYKKKQQHIDAAHLREAGRAL